MFEGSLKVQWNEDLATGHLETDNQHKMLIDIINELAEAIETQQTAAKMNEILSLLFYYTQWHFEREERCMERLKCPLAEVNRTAHGTFIHRVKQFQQEYRENPAVDFAEKVYKELVHWLLNHIRKIDASLKDTSGNAQRPSG